MSRTIYFKTKGSTHPDQLEGKEGKISSLSVMFVSGAYREYVDSNFKRVKTEMVCSSVFEILVLSSTRRAPLWEV